jgi:hypothetical protein
MPRFIVRPQSIVSPASPTRKADHASPPHQRIRSQAPPRIDRAPKDSWPPLSQPRALTRGSVQSTGLAGSGGVSEALKTVLKTQNVQNGHRTGFGPRRVRETPEPRHQTRRSDEPRNPTFSCQKRRKPRWGDHRGFQSTARLREAVRGVAPQNLSAMHHAIDGHTMLISCLYCCQPAEGMTCPRRGFRVGRISASLVTPT